MNLVIYFSEPLSIYGDFILKDLQNYPHIELVVVMVIIPSICNTTCFWITDNILR